MPIGATLRSTGSGEVIEADAFCAGRGSCNNGAGNIVVIEHRDGRFSRYLHLASVSVNVGDQVVAGDVIGTNGVTGHFSSPHLHFDEQWPLGTRVNLGSMVGCVNGIQVRYPAAFGVDNWDQVPFGSIMVNEGYGCLSGATGAQLAATDVPRVFGGPTRFAIAPPVGSPKARYDISVNYAGRSEPMIFQLTGAGLERFDMVPDILDVRARQIIDGVPQRWSIAVQYDPSQEMVRRTCDGLYATQDIHTGTPQADVIIGTNLNDTINGSGGHDIICGLAGDDRIAAGSGADLVFAGEGNDSVSGGSGSDTIYGQAGNDTLAGNKGSDRLRGSVGKDTLNGGKGRDALWGGGGTDFFAGGPGNDRCVGSASETTASCER